MKKVFFLLCFMFCITSCDNATKKSIPIIEWTDSIITKYPNYHSNDLIKSVVNESVDNYSKNLINKQAKILEGVDFRFVKMVENKDRFVVFFDAARCYSNIDYKSGNKKHILTDIIIRVLGKVDKATASKLQEDKYYNISGVVHEWDKDDRFFISHSSLEKIDFGTFILDKDIEIKEVKDEQ